MCRTCHEVPVAPPRSACDYSTGAPCPGPTGLPRPTDVPRCVSSAACTLQVSHICVQCTCPVCSTELISVLQHSTSSPGEQEHRGDGSAWGWDPPGTPLGLRSVGSGVQRWCSVSAQIQGRRAVFSVHFSFPVSTSRHMELSLPFPPPSSPQHPSAHLGGSHPPTAPSPWSALLLPTPVLLDTQLGVRSAATPTSSKAQGLRQTPGGFPQLPLPQGKAQEISILGLWAEGLIWLHVSITQLILVGKRICFSPNNSEEAFSSVLLILSKALHLAQPRCGAFLGFSFPFAASVALPEVKRFGKAAGRNGKVQ